MFKRSRFPSSLLIISIAIAITAVRSDPINGSDSRKLDELDQSKCGGCPCGTTCTPVVYSSPPPPPTYLPPPPPPPPPPKVPKPSTGYCPPPPSPPSNFIYYMGPPGNLYPVDQTYNGAGRSFAATLPAAVGGALVALFMLW
ncbi:hypothetical protein V2J09_012737 [Rumex salicifolius]